MEISCIFFLDVFDLQFISTSEYCGLGHVAGSNIGCDGTTGTPPWMGIRAYVCESSSGLGFGSNGTGPTTKIHIYFFLLKQMMLLNIINQNF